MAGSRRCGFLPGWMTGLKGLGQATGAVDSTEVVKESISGFRRFLERSEMGTLTCLLASKMPLRCLRDMLIRISAARGRGGELNSAGLVVPEQGPSCPTVPFKWLGWYTVTWTIL